MLHYGWLLVILAAVGCPGEGQQEKRAMSPIINMKLDPRKKMITWNYQRNFTQHTCKIDTPDSPTSQSPQVRENDTYFCTFPNSVLHRGAILSVDIISDGYAFQEVLTFNNSGKEGSGAVNFSCLIYDIHFMNCSWSAGPAAPQDVQYHLYKWDTWFGEEAECSQYLSDPKGMHVGCHFNKLSEPNRMDNYFFLLNGTSCKTAIPFLDFTPFEALRIEKYNPPSNITVNYNGSNHIIQWDNPQTRFDVSSHMLYYELDLQKEGSSRDPVFQTGADTNVYLVPRADAAGENYLRMRVRHLRGHIWSEWSEALCFGFKKQGFDGTVAVIVLVVGVATALTLALMFLFKRYSVRQKLFPPIPQVKGELAGIFIQNAELAWYGNSPPDAQESGDMLVVQDTG
ncbi:granulocyte-macrophage colony-stimulating factor receptor subunit alpha-like isoform X2 [Tamandua tetradactyla]|uniref:granulocyte-macrophage colony-stimulating factor receptor subunit alpha-like isoform X2 n=1 Tax=Tamandua tetradactyla TaxID=48850 RepID=UPI004053A75A